MVIDGAFRFETGTAQDPDFTYNVLYGVLMGAGFEVTRQHRDGDPGLMLPAFKFTDIDLLQFDVIWMIAHHGRNSGMMTGDSGAFNIHDDEIAAIARFMDAGGGVFAVGDHDGVGADMCGHIPRIRAMRSWYGVNDTASPMPAGFPRNFPQITAGRADTTQRNPASDYGGDTTFVWFENQSDSLPQPLVPSPPTHPILKVGGADVTVFPDHMHEGDTLGIVMGYDYGQTLSFNGESFVEFPSVGGNQEMPGVIAKGHTTGLASKYSATGAFVGMDSAASTPKDVNTLSTYDGRKVGVGRIVTGSTFHHYIDINLMGDSTVDTMQELARATPSAQKPHGFNDAPTVRDTINAVYVNITNWLARPRPSIGLILERSTFSQDEVMANPLFPGAFLVTIDGLKPNQFPGGPISHTGPLMGAETNWAPHVTSLDPNITITPTRVDSDDPMLLDRLQRITFTYDVTIAGGAFGFGTPFNTIEVDASLTSPAAPAALTDKAWIQLVKSANPFMLDLDNNNTTSWLSSDVRIFPVVADGNMHHGQTLGDNANRGAALTYLHQVVGAMTIGQFEALPHLEDASALSPFAKTTSSMKNVYNFAIARVRLNHAMAQADHVRVYFRVVPSPTTAGLTYHSSGGFGIGSYNERTTMEPIALPGANPTNTDWISFPCFATGRAAAPADQHDMPNDKPIPATVSESSTFYGALIDNNLDDAYLPQTPGGGAMKSMKDLMTGEHQCLVAQIRYDGAPIPDGANPATSDKLAQRNIAFAPIANPGIDASRLAFHTFEIEAANHPIRDDYPPDELLLDWRREPPDGTHVSLYIPSWNAEEVVALADRFYPRHEIRVVDSHTVALPGGGMRYVPIPPTPLRHTGVIAADFPIGVKRGQRFDLAVRQVSNRGREPQIDPPKVEHISLAEAARLVAGLGIKTQAEKGDTKAKAGADKNAAAQPPRGVFDLGGNKVLITDLRVLDATGDHAVLIEHPDPAKVAAARRDSGWWRETIGAFQIGIPVSVKAEMLAHHLRLLSTFRWRAEHLSPNNRWYAPLRRYVELLAAKVLALGGDPWSIPTGPDGTLPGKEGTGGGDKGLDGGDGDDGPCGSTGLGELDEGQAHSGKVSGLLFDHFGDFEGFTLESYGGAHHRYFSREAAILGLARTAWLERYVVAVVTVSADSREVRHLILRGYPD
jgi:hypothetical protein